jgi:CheY-like chemotaxis protein
MDCQMPVMDGFAATRAIRDGMAGEEVREIQIIAMTANALSGDRSACLAAGMNDYVSKPVSLEKLADALIHYFERCQEIAAALPAIPHAIEDPLDGEDLESLFPPELIELFFSETTTMLAQLYTATTADDLATIQKIAHALKGMAGNFSFAEPVCELATQIDHAAKAGDLATAKATLATLQQTFNDLQR